jgi:hypothetical protein
MKIETATVTVVMQFNTRAHGREKVVVKNVMRSDSAINQVMEAEGRKRHATPSSIWFF